MTPERHLVLIRATNAAESSLPPTPLPPRYELVFSRPSKILDRRVVGGGHDGGEANVNATVDHARPPSVLTHAQNIITQCRQVRSTSISIQFDGNNNYT